MLLLLEHMNLKVPLSTGEEDINRFYVHALGAPVCPTGQFLVAPPGGFDLPVGAPKQMHVNMGLSQMHFEWSTGQGKGYQRAQRLAGHLTIAVDSLDALAERLTRFGFAFARDSSTLVVVDPFGCEWRCREAESWQRELLIECSPIRAGGYGNVLAILGVEFLARKDVAEVTADFFADALGARRIGAHAFGTSARQVFSFHETDSAPAPDAYETENDLRGIHFCFYVGDYERVAQSAFEKGRFWINPDYRGPPINDDVDTLEKALRTQQFRMKRCGPKLVLELEIRGVGHRLAPNGLAALEARAAASGGKL